MKILFLSPKMGEKFHAAHRKKFPTNPEGILRHPAIYFLKILFT
ncbi:hypothetical protein BACIT_1406 [Bacillus amyloliquefaciens]|nr:hypothetical protein BACIT_1406 [Bacillus amyloliquefaciens]